MRKQERRDVAALLIACSCRDTARTSKRQSSKKQTVTAWYGLDSAKVGLVLEPV